METTIRIKIEHMYVLIFI